METGAQQLLSELFPLPSPQMVVVYQLEGKVGLGGTLELLLAEGGYRRENWTLTSELEGHASQLRMTVIRRPDLLWTALDDEPGVIVTLPFAQLAQDYLARPEHDKIKILAAVQQHTTTLQDARLKSPGERREVAGVSCLSIRAAAQNLCLWEEAGIALDYQGASFRLTAIKIDRTATLAADAFELPTQAGEAIRDKLDAGVAELDVGAWLDRMAQGHHEAMLELGQPGFEIPGAAKDWMGGATQ